MRESIRFRSKYRVVTPYFDCLMKCKPCYEGLKEIGVDVNDILRKILWFWSKYRVVTPYFDCLAKWNPVMNVWNKSELMSMRYEGKYWILE